MKSHGDGQERERYTERQAETQGRREMKIGGMIKVTRMNQVALRVQPIIT